MLQLDYNFRLNVVKKKWLAILEFIWIYEIQDDKSFAKIA